MGLLSATYAMTVKLSCRSNGFEVRRRGSLHQQQAHRPYLTTLLANRGGYPPGKARSARTQVGPIFIIIALK